MSGSFTLIKLHIDWVLLTQIEVPQIEPNLYVTLKFKMQKSRKIKLNLKIASKSFEQSESTMSAYGSKSKRI